MGLILRVKRLLAAFPKHAMMDINQPLVIDSRPDPNSVSVIWDEGFRRVTGHIFLEFSVKTWFETDVAVIKSKG